MGYAGLGYWKPVNVFALSLRHSCKLFLVHVGGAADSGLPGAPWWFGVGRQFGSDQTLQAILKGLGAALDAVGVLRFQQRDELLHIGAEAGPGFRR